MKAILAFFEELGLEDVDVNEEPAFFQELDEGRYAVVTDLDGLQPQSLEEPLYWTLYSAEDEFCWTVTLTDAMQLRDFVREAADAADLVTRFAALREQNIAAFESEQGR